MLSALRRHLRLRGRLPVAAKLAQAARAAVDKAPETVDASLQALGTRTAKVGPALLAAAGAGVAVWWWTSWARGRAESELAEKDQG